MWTKTAASTSADREEEHGAQALEGELALDLAAHARPCLDLLEEQVWSMGAGAPPELARAQDELRTLIATARRQA